MFPRLPFRTVALTAFFWAGTSLAGLADDLRITGDQWVRMDGGEIVVGIGPDHGGSRLYQVMGLVNASPARAWRMLMDFPNYTKIFSVVAKSDVRKRISDRHLHHYQEFTLPWPLNTRWFVNDVIINPEKLTYSWTNIEGNVKEQRGSWTVLPRHDKAVLVYQLNFDPDAPWFPKFLLNIGQRITLPSAIKDTRKAVARY